MAVMVTMLTRADLDALPDDNRRHELIDGQLIMTPAPGTNHQTVADALTSRCAARFGDGAQGGLGPIRRRVGRPCG